MLSVCPNLHTLVLPNALISGFESEVTPIWESQLRVLHLGLFLQGNRLDGQEDRGVDISATTAIRVALSFMVQLGQQRQLLDLYLSFNNSVIDGACPILEMSVESPNGQKQLGELSRLEKVNIYGLQHSVGDTEVAWIAKHWLRWRRLQLTTE